MFYFNSYIDIIYVRMEDLMKKIISLFCVFVLSISLIGCKKEDSFVYLNKNVKCELLDVLLITNDKDNSTYYYFLANITNSGKKPYDTKDLSYKVTENDKKDISIIDKYQSVPSYTLQKGESTYIYGYIGFPNNDQKNLGISFTKEKEFLSFNSFDVRKSSNDSVNKSKKLKYIFFEDETLKISVDASKATFDFEYGKTVLKNIKIKYKNKTKNRIIVPYLTPTATLEGVNLSNQDYSSYSLEDMKNVDFTTNGLPPKSESFDGNPVGYILYFLEKGQSLDANVSFEFENAIPDFTDTETKPFTVNINSKPFGVSNSFKIEL